MSLMRHTILKTPCLKDGMFLNNLNQEVDCFLQVLLFKITWQNYGHFLTLLCLSCLTLTNNSMSGFLKISKPTAKIKSSLIKFKFKGFMLFLNLLCYVEWKKMCNMKSEESLNTESYAKWLKDKNFYMIQSKKN